MSDNECHVSIIRYTNVDDWSPTCVVFVKEVFE